MRHPELAATFEAVAEHGPSGFYTGRIAKAIVELISSGGGVMTLEDLAECKAEVIEPIKYDFRKDDSDPGVTLWEVSFLGHRIYLTGSVRPMGKA
jgi:gamma-glutamyltranspeptidase/glutathione hydrolase